MEFHEILLEEDIHQSKKVRQRVHEIQEGRNHPRERFHDCSAEETDTGGLAGLEEANLNQTEPGVRGPKSDGHKKKNDTAHSLNGPDHV